MYYKWYNFLFKVLDESFVPKIKFHNPTWGGAAPDAPTQCILTKSSFIELIYSMQIFALVKISLLIEHWEVDSRRSPPAVCVDIRLVPTDTSANTTNTAAAVTTYNSPAMKIRESCS